MTLFFSTLANACCLWCSGLEKELEELFHSNQIQASFDSHNQVLYARHADQRRATFHFTLRTGIFCFSIESEHWQHAFAVHRCALLLSLCYNLKHCMHALLTSAKSPSAQSFAQVRFAALPGKRQPQVQDLHSMEKQCA